MAFTILYIQNHGCTQDEESIDMRPDERQAKDNKSDSWSLQGKNGSCFLQSGQGTHNITLSILCWNIEGICSKLYDQELLDYLSSFDIFALLETWECSQEGWPCLFPNHECLFSPAVSETLRMEEPCQA